MRVIVVGGGIVGLAAARSVLSANSDAEVILVEKELDVARHQTGHNSGVVHAGLYYKPGSLKARLCRRGMGLLREYCGEQGLLYEECGKVLVATSEEELVRLADIQERAEANGVPGVTSLGESDLRAIEPHVGGLGGLRSPTTAIVDYGQVARSFRDDLVARGATVRLGTRVSSVRNQGARPEVELAGGSVLSADRVLVCAGLHADQLARASGRYVRSAHNPVPR